MPVAQQAAKTAFDGLMTAVKAYIETNYSIEKLMPSIASQVKTALENTINRSGAPADTQSIANTAVQSVYATIASDLQGKNHLVSALSYVIATNMAKMGKDIVDQIKSAVDTMLQTYDAALTIPIGPPGSIGKPL